MFTGIITESATLTTKEDTLFTFQAKENFCKKIDNGTSIAINGVCLTVCAKTKDTFSLTVMPETVKKTMLSTLQTNALVNIELPVTPETLLSGHIVQGHVDGVGTIQKIKEEGNSRLLFIDIPTNLSKYIVQKGSIAINGISLTVIASEPTYCTIGIIPFTWKQTMLHQIQVYDKVNIEVDVLAKYVEKLLQKETKNNQ